QAGGHRLDGGPRHAPRPPREAPAGQLEREVGRACAARQVDRVDFAQEGERSAAAELLGAGDEGPHVLRQAATAVAEPGAQEGRPDTRIGAEDVRQGPYVPACGLAYLGHRVDERDLADQETVVSR